MKIIIPKIVDFKQIMHKQFFKIAIVCFLYLALSCESYSQVTYDPYCYTNATSFKIDKITISDYYTIVNISACSTSSNTFWVNSGMYIRRADDYYSTKYYIREFIDYSLDTKYTLTPYNTYHFTWKFDKLPVGLTSIDILEPPSSDGTPWYWKGLNINNPNTSKISIFFQNEGLKLLAYMAHPSNTFDYGTCSVYEDHVYAKIYYKGYTAEFNIKREYGMFTNISVISDDDFLSPFTVIEVLKNVTWDYINKYSDNEKRSRFEKIVNKQISEMNGSNMTCLILSLRGFEY